MKSLADKAATDLGNPRNRKSYGHWTPFAEAVHILVGRGYGVSEATRAVLQKGGEDVSPKNISIVRVLYYKVRDQAVADESDNDEQPSDDELDVSDEQPADTEPATADSADDDFEV